MGFLISLPGQIVIVAVFVAVLAAIWAASPSKIPKSQRTTAMATCSAMVACAFVSNNMLPKITMPQGGSATLFSMLFLYLAGYIYGAKNGITAGVIYGILDFIFKPSAYYPMQVVLDYPIAFAMVGAGAIARNMKNGLAVGYLLGMAGRFFASMMSGAIFFGSYAPIGYSAFGWSIYYNITYLGFEALMTAIVLFVPSLRSAIENAKRKSASQ
ncbi:MAG: energy-coupled thiamine transporter ThiT [Eubacteriaceae bacterium]|nr:energy-coupled thiamine transporter ThiT [Eubacteriaceae bacterium]